MKILIAIDARWSASEVTKVIADFNLSTLDHYKIIHVIPTPQYAAERYLPQPLMDEMDEDRTRQGRAMLRNTALKFRKHCPTSHVTEQILEGNPTDEILRLAQSWQADLIVLGSSRWSGPDTMLCTTIPERIVTEASCPVLIVRRPSAVKTHDKPVVACKAAT